MNYDNRYDGIGVIETAHAASVLIFLLSNDGCRKSDIYRNVSHTATMSKKIDMLEESGLVMQNETARGVNIFLTDAGREVALHLSEIERIIDSSVVSDRRTHRDSVREHPRCGRDSRVPRSPSSVRPVKAIR